MKTWLKGGIIGVVIILLLFILLWMYQSNNFNCLLEPTQVMNLGGPDCHFKNYLGASSILFFIILALIGFLLGSLIGFITRKIKNKE